MFRKVIITAILALVLASCEEIQPDYPDEPVIDYKSFGFFVKEDELGNLVLNGRLSFTFTDGDGNLGLQELADELIQNQPDSAKYNFYLQLWDIRGSGVVEVPENEGGFLRYRIPYMDKQPLSGTIDLDISYPIIVYDTIYYTFWIYDRDNNMSNIDTTQILYLSNIVLDTIQ